MTKEDAGRNLMEHWDKLVFAAILIIISFLTKQIWEQSQQFSVQVEITKQNTVAIKSNQEAIRMLQTEAAEQRGTNKAKLESIERSLDRIERAFADKPR